MRAPIMDRLEQRVVDRGRVLLFPAVRQRMDPHHRRDLRSAIAAGFLFGLVVGLAVGAWVA